MIKFWGTRPLLIKGAKIHFLSINTNAICILMKDTVLSQFLTFNFVLFLFLNQKNILLYSKTQQIMKKITSYIFLLFVIISCQEEVKFNNPSFQGQKDNFFWRAVDSKATISAGSLTIEALTSTEKVTLKTTSIIPGTYMLGNGITNKATYSISDGIGTANFSTGFADDEGQIVITDYDASNKTITGTFKFNANNTNLTVGSFLNFQKGVFYKVPVTN